MSKKERIVCGLDVGSGKTCIVGARAHCDGRLEVIGSGYASSCALTKGVMVNLEEAAASIRRAAQELESESGISVDWVVAGISGDHIQSHNLRGAIAVKGKHQEVTAENMAQVIHAAQAVSLPLEREVLHVLPQEFFLDTYDGIKNPVGLTGSQLEANVHVVTCDSALIQNLVNAVNRAQMRVRKVAFQSLASGEAVLTPDEKEHGAALIDIGGGTTGVALFVRDSVCFASVIPVGGGHFTSDLVEGISTPSEEAERVKKEFGSVWPERIADEEVISVRGFGTRGVRDLPWKEVCDILRCRAVELLRIVKNVIDRSGWCEQLVTGAVLTGGGSMLGGILELAAEILEMPVRQGIPQGLNGLSPSLAHPAYAGAIGLALLDVQDTSRRWKRHNRSASAPPWIDGFLSWFGG